MPCSAECPCCCRASSEFEEIFVVVDSAEICQYHAVLTALAAAELAASLRRCLWVWTLNGFARCHAVLSFLAAAELAVSLRRSVVGVDSE